MFSETADVEPRESRTGAVWFRRDLRLEGNPAWAQATNNHDRVVGIFVLEPSLIDAAGARRRDALFANLRALDARLRQLGGGLSVRAGPATTTVPSMVSECSGGALYVNRDQSPFARSRDAAVSLAVEAPVIQLDGSTVHAPGAVLTRAGSLSKVFTPFYRRWIETPIEPWPEPGPAEVFELPGKGVPAPSEQPGFQPGEAGASARLEEWLEMVDQYGESRDLLADSGTSMLSADLHFGTVSARAVVERVGNATEGRAAFVRQLAWRDWWAHTLADQPDLPRRSIGAGYDRIDWTNDPRDIAAWEGGRTGFPVVDAAMNQLLQTGWMHNRARMIAASFLVKDLLVDWRHGERFFRRHLVDGDVAQNAGNWQWVAGTGPDAAPYFRVFNPTTQARKFDPGGDYIRRWVPELAALAPPHIHEPAAAPVDVLEAAGVRLGHTYPHPIVDHSLARERVIHAYKAALG